MSGELRKVKIWILHFCIEMFYFAVFSEFQKVMHTITSDIQCFYFYSHEVTVRRIVNSLWTLVDSVFDLSYP